jgi:hypothetical protein
MIIPLLLSLPSSISVMPFAGHLGILVFSYRIIHVFYQFPSMFHLIPINIIHNLASHTFHIFSSVKTLY